MIMLQNQFTIKMAGLTIQIEAFSPRTCILCRNYLSDGKPDIIVKISEEDVEFERNEMNSFGKQNREVFLETNAVYRKIVEKMIYYNVFLMHGAVVSIDNKAFMFSAPSGTGKTTHVKHWINNLKDAFIVNGDKPLIKVTGNEILACGTPWCGNEHYNRNIMVPLKSIVFMERSDDNHIEKIGFGQAYPYLIGQTYIPHEEVKAKKTLNLLSGLGSYLSFWKFQCNNFKQDCFQTSFDALMNSE